MAQQQAVNPTPTSQLRKPQQGSGWYPQLSNTGLSQSAQNAITMVYQLLYSQRDSQNQLSTNVNSLIGYSTHNQRTNFNKDNTAAVGVQLGALIFETDRATVFYQARINQRAQAQQWFYAGGIYADILANQPTDLGQNDLGYLFLATDSAQFYRWDGTTWNPV